MLGLALLIGQQHQLKNTAVLPLAVLIGLIFNHIALFSVDAELILLILALMFGLLLTLRLTLPSIIMLIFLMIGGVMLGLASSPIMIPGLGANSIYSWRIGAAITLILGIVLFALLANFLNRYWNGIILRIAGSWIATSAIFVLTLMLAGR